MVSRAKTEEASLAALFARETTIPKMALFEQRQIADARMATYDEMATPADEAWVSNPARWPQLRRAQQSVVSFIRSPFAGLQAAVQQQLATATPDEAAAPLLAAANPDEGGEPVLPPRTAPAGSAPDEPPAGGRETSLVARWCEDLTPYLVLLLLVFLQRHFVSLLVFCWLTSLLNNANGRMRRQTLLKEKRSRAALAALLLLLSGQLTMIALLEGAPLFEQLRLAPRSDYAASPPQLPTVLWDSALADLFVRVALLALKAWVAFICPNGCVRRLRGVYTSLEAVGLVYRTLLPTQLWWTWLVHACAGPEAAATVHAAATVQASVSGAAAAATPATPAAAAAAASAAASAAAAQSPPSPPGASTGSQLADPPAYAEDKEAVPLFCISLAHMCGARPHCLPICRARALPLAIKWAIAQPEA